LILAGVTLRTNCAHHLGLQHAAHLEHLARFLHGGRGDEGAARLLHLHQPVLRQLEQRLRTSVRETPKWSASFCSASLVPGCSRCRRSRGSARRR
jgi:hypothetical protein